MSENTKFESFPSAQLNETSSAKKTGIQTDEELDDSELEAVVGGKRVVVGGPAGEGDEPVLGGGGAATSLPKVKIVYGQG
ncbi:MAG TPA: hypothetical protein V6D11_12830 [Waterburya sp.]|jgi:hypothetical protein